MDRNLVMAVQLESTKQLSFNANSKRFRILVLATIFIQNCAAWSNFSIFHVRRRKSSSTSIIVSRQQPTGRSLVNVQQLKLFKRKRKISVVTLSWLLLNKFASVRVKSSDLTIDKLRFRFYCYDPLMAFKIFYLSTWLYHRTKSLCGFFVAINYSIVTRELRWLSLSRELTQSLLINLLI